MLKKLNKKAENDLITIGVALFTIAILGLIVLYVNSQTTAVMQTFVEEGSLASNALSRAEATFVNGLDKLFLGIFIILLIGMVILSLFISASILFLPVYLIIAAIAVWIAAILSNAYIQVQATEVFASVLDNFTMQNFIMENLPYFTAGFAFILLIVTYGKAAFMGGQQQFR
jgi:hypothetical protein